MTFRIAPDVEGSVERVVLRNGTPLYALQEMGGWASTMVRRYAHLAADHVAPFAERLCALRAVNAEVIGTKKSHPAN